MNTSNKQTKVGTNCVKFVKDYVIPKFLALDSKHKTKTVNRGHSISFIKELDGGALTYTTLTPAAVP